MFIMFTDEKCNFCIFRIILVGPGRGANILAQNMIQWYFSRRQRKGAQWAFRVQIIPRVRSLPEPWQDHSNAASSWCRCTSQALSESYLPFGGPKHGGKKGEWFQALSFKTFSAKELLWFLKPTRPTFQFVGTSQTVEPTFHSRPVRSTRILPCNKRQVDHVLFLIV